MKEETHEEKLQRYIFKACGANRDSETEFDTRFEQCASEKKNQKRKDKRKWR